MILKYVQLGLFCIVENTVNSHSYHTFLFITIEILAKSALLIYEHYKYNKRRGI